MFTSALGNLCIVICGLTVLLSAFFIWRAESLTARLIIAAVGAAVLIFRWQISMMIYQFVASIFTLIALFIGIVLLCACPSCSSASSCTSEKGVAPWSIHSRWKPCPSSAGC